MAGDGPLVIKRVRKVANAGHHGGAWKVAYADFVTAMMAFFLLMWLINTTTPEQKRGIADYFAAQNISRSQSGAGGVLAGTQFGTDGARAGGTVASVTLSSPERAESDSSAKVEGQASGGESDSDRIASEDKDGRDDQLERQMPSREDRIFQSAEISIRQAMQQMPDIAELSRNVLMERTPDGLNIQLVDQDGQSMFQAGSSNLVPKARLLLQEVAKIVDRLPNRIAITGHTDGAQFLGAGGITNWELSASRANAARAVLALEGIESDRVYTVSGRAGSDPLLPDNPLASSNRRIAILLMREAPVVPPGHKL